MFRRILIANRGEIACRIIRTARRLGIETVAVHSDADAAALHVRMADRAVRIGPASAAGSYLRGEVIIAAALETGAEAIHPGYGFLSENADFAQAVADAGLIFVGPRPPSIRAMGLKDAAKQRMRAAGVPVTPGYDGADQSERRLLEEARAIGWPVLIKAVAGGGGKGMRLVESEAGFAAALESCRREAQASFGNAAVLLEKWIAAPRHIEVQVFGDTHGNVVHLFERDCSLQRRHQKVIEEAPAPGMDEATRAAICAAAVRAAQAVDYVGAGTVEFIADASAGLDAERIFFMEMNTRLQVEHPVTEAITGVDLVEWQLRVAAGEGLPLAQDALRIEGHAIEARLYAEDPARGFLPSPGRIEHLHFDPAARVETGVEEGDSVSGHYDPMIAKLVCHAPTREEARQRLVAVLDRSFVLPLRTNQAFLRACLVEEDFCAGRLDTGLIARHEERLVAAAPPSPAALGAAAGLFAARWGAQTPRALSGFRLNAAAATGVVLHCEGSEYRADLAPPAAAAPVPHARLVSAGEAIVTENGQAFLVTLSPARRAGKAASGSGAVLAPMPGRVIAVDVAPGEAVSAGQRLLVLEAMKMEHALTAPFDGTVAELTVEAGAQAEVEQLLARIAPLPA